MKIGLYPGSFDPVTFGHFDIIKRALNIVDKLVIGVSTGEEKKPIFDIDKRIQMISDDIKHFVPKYEITIVPIDCLLVEFVKNNNINFVIRGLRTVDDFIYEFQLNGMNKILDKNIESIFLLADTKHTPIASKLVKSIALYGGDVSKFVSANVAVELRKYYQKNHETN